VLALAAVQPGQQRTLADQQVGQGRVGPRHALLGQRDQDAPLIPGVGFPADQARLSQPVDPVGHGARGDQGGAEQRAGGQLERRPLPAQRGEHVELPRLQAMVGERAAPRDVQVPGQPGDPAEHLHRLHVEVGPLRPPRGDQLIDLVPQPGNLKELRLVSITRGDDPPRPPRKRGLSIRSRAGGHY
jgi:hypothetical protein